MVGKPGANFCLSQTNESRTRSGSKLDISDAASIGMGSIGATFADSSSTDASSIDTGFTDVF